MKFDFNFMWDFTQEMSHTLNNESNTDFVTRQKRHKMRSGETNNGKVKAKLVKILPRGNF